jgi:hypothetical protein
MIVHTEYTKSCLEGYFNVLSGQEKPSDCLICHKRMFRSKEDRFSHYRNAQLSALKSFAAQTYDYGVGALLGVIVSLIPLGFTRGINRQILKQQAEIFCQMALLSTIITIPDAIFKLTKEAEYCEKNKQWLVYGISHIIPVMLNILFMQKVSNIFEDNAFGVGLAACILSAFQAIKVWQAFSS